MENFLTEAQQFAKNFMDIFLIQRDARKLRACFSSAISFVDIGEAKIAKGQEVVMAYVEKNIAAHPEPFSLADESYSPFAISEDAYCVIGKLKVISSINGKTVIFLRLRCSCVIQVAPDHSMKLAHLHVSLVEDNPITEEVSPRDSGEQNFLMLQKILHEKTAEINNFYNVLSGGICKIVFDEAFTVIYASSYLLDMFGLNADDITANHNQTVNFVFDEDIPYIMRILTQASKGREMFTARYRIRHKSGHYLWVKVTGMFTDELYQGHPVYYCIYTDITELMHSYEQIARERERYRIITELTEGITFEYDLSEDCIEFPNRYEQYFDCPAVISNFKRGVTRDYFATEEDYSQYRDLCKALSKGEDHASAELRFKTRDGAWIWFSVMLSTLFDEYGRPIKAIGKLTDINQQKLEQVELENRSRLDPMTGLYNKVAAEQQIKSYISVLPNDTMAALFVIDIDNFKTVNDMMGHFVGDHVLCSIAEEMKKIFRKSDILCRFGGDEFVIFMKDIYSESLILEKASLLCRSIAASYHPDISSYSASLSIGIAVMSGSSPLMYQQLFQRADKALYVAKNNGKNRFEIYNTTMDVTSFAEDTFRDDTTVKFYTQGQSYQVLIDTALDILLRSEDEKIAVESILKFLGVSLNLYQSYASVFVDKEINVIVQWHESGAHQLPDSILLSKEEMLEQFSGSGIFLCSGTSRLPGPARDVCTNLDNGAILQCLICKNEKIIGFAGFSAREESRIWTQGEIDILQTITKIITNSVIRLAAGRI